VYFLGAVGITVPKTKVQTLQLIVVAELGDEVFSRLQSSPSGNYAQLLGAHSYHDLREILSRKAVAWVLCDSQLKEQGAEVWQLLLSDYPEILILVFYPSASALVAEDLAEAGVLGVELEGLLEPNTSTLFLTLSMLHELNDRLRKLRENFWGKERLARLGELTRGIFHDLNNRLTGIIGFLEMTKMRNPQFRDLDGVIAQCKQMDVMFTNVLRIARQERIRDIRLLNLNTLLREELKLLEGDPLYRDMVVKEMQFDDSIPPIYGIYSDFSLSFLNIAKNAVESMHSSAERVLRVNTKRDDEWIYLTVADTGIGIEEQDIPKIFRPFFTTKPIETRDGIPTGTGLGLANARELLTKYGTQWEVDSKVGQGTRITLKIPLKTVLTEPSNFR
jgi:signal transduction histidine kinase